MFRLVVLLNLKIVCVVVMLLDVVNDMRKLFVLLFVIY